MNIDVLARIRPPQRGEGAHNLKIQGSKIKQDETNASHTFHAIFDDDSTTDTIYQESVSSMVDLMVAGFNCSLLSIGESGSGKSHTLLGDGKSRLGVVHMAVRGVFDQLGDTRERASRNDSLMNGQVTLSMYEVYNEIVRDLLKPTEGTPNGGGPSELTVNAKKWVHVKELTQSTLRTESDALSELSRGLNERTQASTDYGRIQAKATLFVEVTLKMEKEEFGYPHESRFLFVELPGIEKLALNQQELRKKEGAVQNRSISSFGQLISNLSTRQSPDRVINYSESKVTSLLENAIGGNCKTKAIMHFSPNPQPLHLKTSLIVSAQLSRINNFFIMNDMAARALITQYHARLISLQGQLGVTMTTEPARDDVTEDQAKLARDNLKLKEENDYLRRRLDQIQSRFGDIASAKTDLSSRLIGSEEEKLKLSKMLVDLRIENNKLKERGAQENFELKNKALITQYHARLISLQGQLGVTMTTEPARDDVTEDQAKLARDNLKLKEENDYLRRRLDQIQSRFGDIASAKTDLSSRLIGSEEEKLKLSKMLVDLRIENNKLKERGAQENFELKNKVLALENRMIQAESERDRLLRDYRQIRGHFDEIDKERQDVGDRYVYLNADYKALAKKYESEVARNQQLGLELLNLMNAEVTLLKQRDNLGLAAGQARNAGSDDLSRVRDIALGLSAERQKVAATDSDRHDLRQHLFGNQDRFRGEIDQMKSHYDNEQDKLQGIIVTRLSLLGLITQYNARLIRLQGQLWCYAMTTEPSGRHDVTEDQAKVLALENRMIQAESERDRLLRDYRQIRGHFDEIDKERQDVGDRYVYLNADYKALAKKYESEVARNQQLGLELLNLMNAEVTLLKQRDNLGLAAGQARNAGSDDLSRVRDIALGLSAERQKVAATDSDRHDLRQHLFGNQDRFRGEIDQMKSHYDNEQDKLQGIISQLNQDVQNMRQADRETHRKLTEAEVALLTLRSKSKELQSTNSKLQLQMKEKNEEVRARLVKYLQDIADHIDKSQRSLSSQDAGDGLRGQIAAMMKDLKLTYQARESQLSDAAREYKRTADAVAKKHQQLLVEYRLLRQRTMEKHLPGMEIGPEEDQLTLDVEEVESINRRELTKVMKQLRETETELNKIRREGSSDEHWKSLKDEFLRTQKDLESERANLLANNSVLEEQLNECQDYIHTHMTRYKDEIRRLRRQLGMDDQLDMLGLTDDYGHSRWRDHNRRAHVPQSLRKYRTLPEI
eukprot:XP_011660653.1 PREDICTED: centromere-associated protein E [Strongylocentrotus purpuratus]